jgi:hypothetical protein
MKRMMMNLSMILRVLMRTMTMTMTMTMKPMVSVHQLAVKHTKEEAVVVAAMVAAIMAAANAVMSSRRFTANSIVFAIKFAKSKTAKMHKILALPLSREELLKTEIKLILYKLM